MSGSFPDAATKEGIREIAFRLSYPKTRLGVLSRRRSRGASPDPSASFQLILLRSFEDEVARWRSGGSVAHGTLSGALTSDEIVIMVEATSREARRVSSGGQQERVACGLCQAASGPQHAQDHVRNPIRRT